MAETQEIRGSDRVYIEKSVHSLYQDLTERSNQKPETIPFFTMKDVFMWAFALGVQAGNRNSLTDTKIQIFRWDQFTQAQDIPALKAVAVAVEEDLAVLSQPDRILRIAEEYANAGIHELRELLIVNPGQPLWNLVFVARP